MTDMVEVAAALKSAKLALDRDAPAEALGVLSSFLRGASLSLTTLTAIDRMVAAVAAHPGASDAVPVQRVAVLCGALSPALLIRAVRCAFAAEGMACLIHEGGYASYELDIINPASELYGFAPTIVLVALGYRDVIRIDDAAAAAPEIDGALEQRAAGFGKLWQTVHQRTKATIVQHVVDRPAAFLAGPAERRLPNSPRRSLEAFNQALADAAPGFVFWLDLDALSTQIGLAAWHAPRDYLHGKMPFASSALPHYSTAFRAVVRQIVAKPKKALVLDLDNTLWGGVIGDDGLDGIRFGPGTAEGEAFLAFAQYAKALKQRGVILAVSSKNDPELPRRMFSERADMPLALDDFAAFRCSWEPKPANIRAIAEELNIGLDAVVFVDDNPAECDLVRGELPEVTVVALPAEPSDFVGHLDSLHLFDIQTITETDRLRAASYQAKQAAKALETDATDLDAFLAALAMRGDVHRARASEFERLAQMEARTNQFNLTTRRYLASDIAAFAEDGSTIVLAVSLADKFAQHGIVSSLIARPDGESVRIDSWLMSCRVFSRSLESFILERLVAEARAAGASRVVGEFLPSERNGVVADLFPRLGFTDRDGDGRWWVFDLADAERIPKSFVQDATAPSRSRGDDVTESARIAADPAGKPRSNAQPPAQRLNADLQEARARMKEGRYDEAESILRRTLAFAPDNRGTLLELSNIFELQKRYDEARPFAEELARHHPSAATHRHLGFLLMRMNEPDAAEPALRRSLELDPGDIATALTLTRILTGRNASAEAVDILTAALKVHPEHIAAQSQRATLLMRLGRKPDAEAALRKIVDADPTNLGSVISLLNLLADRRARADGAAVGNRYLERVGPQLEVALKTAAFELQLRNRAAAERLYRLAMEVDGFNLNAALNLQKMLFDDGRRDEARSLNRRVVAAARAGFPATLSQAVSRLVPGKVEGPASSTGLTLPDRDGWSVEKRFGWGAKASGLLAHWGFFAEGGIAEIARSFPAPDWPVLALGHTKGAILVGSHIGTYMPAIAALMQSGLDYRITSVNASFLLSNSEDRTFDAFGDDQHKLLARMCSHVRRNGIVFLAGDGGVGKKYGRIYEHKGCRMTFTIGIPTLAYITKAPIYWYNSVWTENSARIELVKGPDLEEGEALDNWQMRWFDFYWGQIKNALESGPENLNKYQFSCIFK